MRLALVLATATAGLLAAGCATSSIEDVSYGSITGNLTPELQGTAERPVDVHRHMAATNNGNWRQFSDDLGRMFYTDYPSRLNPFPIFSNSGMPR